VHVGANRDRPNLQSAPFGASEGCMDASEFFGVEVQMSLIRRVALFNRKWLFKGGVG
jgi:hypothetical protein